MSDQTMSSGEAPMLRHWVLHRDERDIAWVSLDRAGENTNSLSSEVMGELAKLLDIFEHEPPAGLVFRSAKPAGFTVGADIAEFGEIVTQEGALAVVGRGWTLFNRLASVSYPTLALVRGHCLGGGVEMALACRYVVVTDEPSTRLGLPEVMIGIFPGWGGMLRLPRRIGPLAALDMMLTGKTIDARKAKQLGLADLCVPPRLMERSAAELVLSGKAQRSLPFLQRLLNGPLKRIVALQARRQLARKARHAHYPAPYAILDIWAKHGGNALAAPHLVNEIVSSPTTGNLIRVFNLQDRLKRFGKTEGPAPGRVHVVGAGVMGGDIAAWCALRGLTVSLQDMDIRRIAPAIKRAKTLFERRLKDPLRVRAAMDRLIPDPQGTGAGHADIVIEAIVEDLAAKQQLFRRLETLMRPDALLASNTSSLTLADLQKGMTYPERLVGIHFFNPVAMMPLVEVIEGKGVAPEAFKRACAFVKHIDKLPLPVKDAPGFLVNAVLAPYLHEAMRCVDEGIAPEHIDAAMVSFGMPMGPIELIDTVGLDIALHAGQQLAAAGTEQPRCLSERVARGELGRKTGNGFYQWVNGHPKKALTKVEAAAFPPDLAERLLKPLFDRTRQLVADGIVADADLADAGVIFGSGFAPFTGGPMNYLNQRGQRR